MVKVTQLADDGTETASIELDDFTIEVVYSGIAALLREAETCAAAPPSRWDLPREARQRRERVLRRVRD